jgi:ADP-ribose pyrophosphatase YjhB (NUDIX family)
MAVPSAGVLFFDQQDHVLLVQPRGRSGMEVPGGVTEIRNGESPLASARREVAEELGLDVHIGRLLGIDSVPEGADHPPMLAFIYDGGILTAEQLDAVHFADNEIESYRFVNPTQLDGLLVPRLARRITACALARHHGPEPLYLEHGRMPTATS